MVLDVIGLGCECVIVKLVWDVGNYGVNNKMVLMGVDKWLDLNSDLFVDMDKVKEQVCCCIGCYLNLLIFGLDVFIVLKCYLKIKEQFKYISFELVMVEMLVQYFDVDKVIVGKVVVLEENVVDDVDV